MKPYIVTATDKHGRRDTFAREAASIEHLRNTLEGESYSQIEFVDDEHSASLRSQRNDLGKPRTQAQFRFEASVRRGVNRRTTIVHALRNNAIALLALVGIIVFGIWRGEPILIVVALVILAWGMWWTRSRMGETDTYTELCRAQARGDWGKAEVLIKQMMATKGAQENEQIRIDLAFRKARIMARQGKLAAALLLVAPCKDNRHCANGSFQSRTASIYFSADRLEDFIRCMEEAYEASGHGQLQTLDLAFAHARVGDADKARLLLAQVEQRNLTALHAQIFKAAEGRCLMRSNAWPDASEKLREAVEGLKAFAASAPTWPFQGMIAGYAAIAITATGQREIARTLLSPWKEVALTSLEPASRQLILSEVL